MAELFEATRKVAKYFKRSYKHNKLHPSNNSSCHISANHYGTHHSGKHKCKSCNNNDEVSEVINSTPTSNSTPSEPKNSQEHHNLDSSDSMLNSSSYSEWLSQTDEIIEVKLSNTKYTTHFQVKINKNKTISLFDTDTTISCMSKACFDKLDSKLTLIQTHKYKVNSADGNSLGSFGTTTWTLEFP